VGLIQQLNNKTTFMKKLFSILMIAAAVITGCSSGDDNDNTDPDNGGNGSMSSGLSIDKTAIDAAYTAGTYLLQVTATQAWSAEVNAGATWCTLAGASGNSNGTVTVNVAENPAVETRTATITFTSGTLTRTVNVTQAAAPAMSALTVAPTAIDAAYTAGTYLLQVTATQAWSAEVNTAATWCTISPNAFAGSRGVTVSVADNPAVVQRAATITFTAGTLTRVVSVVQPVAFTFSDADNVPPHAASNKVWGIFGGSNLIWSDAIHIPECNKSSFTVSNTEPHCRSYTESGKTWYYYNWAYVSANAAALCPWPWRVPTWSDCSTLLEIATTSTLVYYWGLGGYYFDPKVYNLDTQAAYWSSSMEMPGGAWYLNYGGNFHDVNAYNLHVGMQVRCVRR
jgi:hypothetical protein